MADPVPAAVDGFPKSNWTPPDTGIQLAPGGAQAAQAMGVAAPAASFEAAPAVAPKRVPVVVDLSGRPMSKDFDLKWPRSVDSVEIWKVVAHRISTAEVAAFIDRVRSAADGDDLPYPIFRRVDGASLTAAEWGALHPDDTDALLRDAEDFLPGRWKVMKANLPEPSLPSVSNTIDNSSDQSQALA